MHHVVNKESVVEVHSLYINQNIMGYRVQKTKRRTASQSRTTMVKRATRAIVKAIPGTSVDTVVATVVFVEGVTVLHSRENATINVGDAVAMAQHAQVASN